jgi:polar amino acid transport system substrate-binding protein
MDACRKEQEAPAMADFDRYAPTRRSLLVGSAAAATAGLSRPARTATLTEIKARGTINVATEDDFRPFEFVQDGKPTGFDTELLDGFRPTAGVKIAQDIIPWSGILAGVATGRYDVAVTAVLITQERLKTLDFTSPVADGTDYYVKRKSDTSINAIKDLSGKKIGVQTGSAMLAALPQLDAMLKPTGGKMGEVIEYQSYPEAYQDLAIGRTDIVVNTAINLQGLVADKPDIFALGQPVAARTYIAWAVKKGNLELRDYLDAYLLGARRTGALYALQKQWFKVSFEDMPEHFVPA